MITSASSLEFAPIVQSLKKSEKYDISVFSCDFIVTPAMQHYSSDTSLIPDSHNDRYAQNLLELCTEKEIDIIIPGLAEDQIPICHNLVKFRDLNIQPTLTLTDPKLLEILLNKHLLLDYCSNILGMKLPRFEIVSTSTELESAASGIGYPSRPLIIQPCGLNTKRISRIIDSSLNQRHSFFREKPTNLYVSFDQLIHDLGPEFPKMIVQEYPHGSEYVIDVLCRKGTHFLSLPWHRLSIKNGITMDGILCNVSNNESISSTVHGITEGLGLSYIFEIQMKEDIDGTLLMLDINAGLHDSTILSIASGINIPQMMIEMALYQFDYETSFDVKWGTRIQRIWQEIFMLNGRTWTHE